MARLRGILRTGRTDTGRVEAFSDGVLAIVITLLVLDIKVPQGIPNEAALWSALAAQLPALGAWVVSFLFVLVFWVSHHYLFDLIEQVDRGMLWLNGLFLLFISFLPFPTALAGQYAGSRPATMILTSVMLATASVLSIMRWYATLHAGLVTPENLPAARQGLRRSLMGPFLLSVALVASVWYPPLAIALQVLVAFLFFLPVRTSGTSA